MVYSYIRYFVRLTLSLFRKETNMKVNIICFAAMTALLVVGCAGTSIIQEKPAALSGDYSGKDFSGAFVMVPDACDIPGVPESDCKKARPRWSSIEKKQVLHIDAHCQAELFQSLPDWAQAIAMEGGWSALAIAVGEAGFAAAFPGADTVRYFLGGLGFGFAAGANTGRYRQEGSEKAAVGYCVTLKVVRAQQRYQILTGLDAVPWFGNSRTTLPKVTDKADAPTLPYVEGGKLPMPVR